MLSPSSTSPITPDYIPAHNPLHYTTAPPTTTTTAKPKAKPRKRVNTAEKRSQHNAIERARRETLNSKFLHLARLLPTLSDARRPSKSSIVNTSISHLAYQRQQRLLAARVLRAVCQERDELLKEVNQWRRMNGVEEKEGAEWREEVEEVVGVEKEAFGTFVGMGMDGEDDDGAEEPAQGLITPRESIDKLPHSLSAWAEYPYPMPPTVANNSDNSPGSAGSVSAGMSYHHPALTPPLSAIDTKSMYSHTPSPASSQGQGEKDVKPSVQQLSLGIGHPQSQGEGVQGAQMMALQQQWFVNQSLQAQAQVHAQGYGYDSIFAHANANANANFSHPPAHVHPLSNAHPTAPAHPAAAGQAQGQDAFTQQLMASIFPGKYAHDQPSLSDLQKAVRTGMGLGYGMTGNVGQWAGAGEAGNALEGF
ncbi:hypothetical protein IAR50_006992 [Cryptococcus sp. DSM 104548]